MKKAFFFFGLLSFYYGTGQQLQTAPQVARTGAYGKAQHQAFQFLTNEAALGNATRFAAGIYGEKRFLVQELSVYHAAVVQPAGEGAFGVHLMYAGDADFNTSKIGLAYGRKLGKKLDAGVQFNYFSNQIRGYGHAAQVSVAAGLLVHFSESFHGGFQVCHPVGIALSKKLTKVPAVYTAGLAYQPSQQFGIATELSKTERLPVALQTSVEYRFAPAFWAKAGINSGTAAFFIAAGFRLTDFSIEMVGSAHPQLGLSPGLMLTYNAMDK